MAKSKRNRLGSFLRRSKPQLSLNHAKLSPEDFAAVRSIYEVKAKKEQAIKQANAELQLMRAGEAEFMQQYVDQYGLRKGKAYQINLVHGYIHRPGAKPWEKEPGSEEETKEFTAPEKVAEDPTPDVDEQVENLEKMAEGDDAPAASEDKPEDGPEEKAEPGEDQEPGKEYSQGYPGPSEPAESDGPPTTDQEIKTNEQADEVQGAGV